jgi:hypothetical protein
MNQVICCFPKFMIYLFFGYSASIICSIDKEEIDWSFSYLSFISFLRNSGAIKLN